MRHRTFAFCLVFLLATMIMPASAYNITSFTVSPSGDIISRDDVIATLNIEFPPPSEKGTFNSEHNLNFQTDISQANWVMTLTIDGVAREPIKKTGSSATYNGYAISQLPYKKVSMDVRLTGPAPNVTTTSNKTILLVQEVNAGTNMPINGTITTYERRILPLSKITVATTAPTSAPTQITTVPTTIPPTTTVTTVATTQISTPIPPQGLSFAALIQQVKGLSLTTIGIIVGILVIIGIVIIVVARRTEAYDEEEEYEEYEEE